MFARIAALALSAAALTAAPAAFATETLQVVSGPASTRAVNVFATGGIGQSFTAFTDTLTSVGFQFNAINAGIANTPLTLQIFGGQTMTGTSLFTTSFTLPGTITGQNTVSWVDLAVPSLALTTGSLYSLVLTGTSDRAGVLLGPDYFVGNGTFGGGDAYAGGKLLTNWAFIYPNCTGAANNCDLNFRVSGENLSAAVPEPATWLTMILGFGLAGAAMRRRRNVMLRTA